jgi:EAL domain-containing protein (putative c-di-GMP-specific phosphodiesterase class I)
MLSRHGLQAQALRIEITETSLMSDPEAALANLCALARLGVGLSLDDFGTGYSSMAYLQRLPVDELKVDRTFTLGMIDSNSDAIIVRSAIDLGHNLGMRVVAEGVEDQITLRALFDATCDVAQGYHIARPMPATQLQEWLDTRTGAATTKQTAAGPTCPATRRTENCTSCTVPAAPATRRIGATTINVKAPA